MYEEDAFSFGIIFGGLLFIGTIFMVIVTSDPAHPINHVPPVMQQEWQEEVRQDARPVVVERWYMKPVPEPTCDFEAEYYRIHKRLTDGEF